MKKLSIKLLLPVFLIILTTAAIRYYQGEKSSLKWQNKIVYHPVDSIFELKKGDILARPNWMGWPGSENIPSGRRYGHVAVVTHGAIGCNVEDALKKATVAEALFFDQKTKRFITNSSDQLREEPAITSFGEKFKGIRYRLRIPMDSLKADSISIFLQSQLDAKYNLLSLKNPINLSKEKSANRTSWNCATLTWKAYNQLLETDIDGNGGILIYPSDIIGSKLFDNKEGRICF